MRLCMIYMYDIHDNIVLVKIEVIGTGSDQQQVTTDSECMLLLKSIVELFITEEGRVSNRQLSI